MMPGLTIEIWAGKTVAEAAVEAQEIADKLQRGVGFMFNSVRCVAVPGGDAQKLADAQQEAQRSRFVVHSDTVKIEMEVADAR